ncbi:MAG: hypothetical protein U0794_22035 [Isosphaeraceae bacterium]
MLAGVGGQVFLPDFWRFWVLRPFVVFGKVRPDCDWFWLDKSTILGLGLFLGIVATEPRRLLRFRPHWLDLALVLFLLYPLTGILVSGSVAFWDALGILLWRILTFGLTYLAARICLDDAEGQWALCVGIAVLTLATAPIYLWESILGPKWYVAQFLYQRPHVGFMAERMGGWRPEGLIGYGIDMTNWIAMGALASFWLWLGGLWKPRWGPAWWPPLLLIVTTFLGHGAYSYAYLALGIVLTLLTFAFRVRFLLIATMALVPLYLDLRYFGVLETEAVSQALRETRGTVRHRLRGEESVLQSQPVYKVFGTGLQPIHSSDLKPPAPQAGSLDQLWLALAYTGGVFGLALYLGSMHVIPVGLGLLSPPYRPDRRSVLSPGWGLCLLSTIQMLDSLQNSCRQVTTPLIAGTLTAVAVSRLRRPADRHRHPSHDPGAERTGDRPQRSRPAGSTAMPASVPAVAALACVFYVFGHGPVDGFETLKLLGGLGAALLFAAVGAVANWAGQRFSAGRLSAYAVAFAAMGVTFNVALHPGSNALTVADILQGLALCGLVIALWQRWAGSRPWTILIPGALGLLLPALAGTNLPHVPGLQYLLTTSASQLSLFPVLPWLTLAALGAWAAQESTAYNLGFGVVLAIAAGLLWFGPLGPVAPVKFPMNMTYALLAGASVLLAFAAARGINASGEPLRRATRWLGARWLVFFYVHFAVVNALQRVRVPSPWLVWTIVAVGGLAGTWLVWTVLKPLGPWFRRPEPWLALLAATVGVCLIPNVPDLAIAAVAGVSGLFLGCHYGELAACVGGVRLASSGATATATASARAQASGNSGRKAGFDHDDWDRPRPVAPDAPNHLGANVVRLAIVLALLALPELVGWITGTGISPAGQAPPASQESGTTPAALPSR